MGWRGNKSFSAGRLKKGVMNKDEAAYEQELKRMKDTGEIIEYWFEGVTFRLAKLTTLTLDFMVLLPTMEIEFHDVKGFFTDDAKVKMKVCADKFPFRLFTVKRKPKYKGGGWEKKQIGV